MELHPGDEEKDLFDVIADQVASGQFKDGWNEENWEQQMEEHPLFMTKSPEDGKLPPLVEAISQVKYDEELNDKHELAVNYKEDGNHNFKMKKYQCAIDCYSKALDMKDDDDELNSILYNNRASAQFYLGNLRSAINDALQALECNSLNEKAAIRVAQCMFQLGKYRECIDYCKQSPFHSKLEQWETKSVEELKRVERNERKLKAEERKKQIKEEAIIKAVERREINYQGSLFQTTHPAAEGHQVHLDEDEKLIWSVLFVYPEYGQTDFIESFHEEDTFLQHLKLMFPLNDDHPPWDVDRKYRVTDLKIAFQDPKTSRFVFFKPAKKLKEILSDEKFIVTSAIPTFVIAPDKKQFIE